MIGRIYLISFVKFKRFHFIWNQFNIQRYMYFKQHLFVLSNSRLLLSLSLFHEEAREYNSINSPFPISKWLHNILTLIDRFILYFF